MSTGAPEIAKCVSEGKAVWIVCRSAASCRIILHAKKWVCAVHEESSSRVRAWMVDERSSGWQESVKSMRARAWLRAKMRA